MVCDRCKLVVKAELEKLGHEPLSVSLGEVELPRTLSQTELELVDQSMTQFGFELLKDKKKQLADQVKTAIISLVHYPNETLKLNLSDYLSQKFNLEYASLSAVFAEIEQTTIEKYFIQQKIEKVKELIDYGEMSLSEIAFFLNYSSVAHLSAQFKKVSGQTPSTYKQDQHTTRKPIDEVH